MIQRAILEGTKNIIRSFWLSATAISVLTVSLGVVVIVSTVFALVGYSIRNLDSLISIPAFIQDTYKEEDIPKLQQRLQAIPEVKSVEYFNKERASNELNNSTGRVSLDVLQSSNTDYKNLVWRFMLITPKDSESYNKVVETLQSQDYDGVWKDVVGSKNFANNLIEFNNRVRVIGAVLILIFALISVLVMVNVLRMTIYNHRDEIEIMRLVGATNNYIRLPFVVEGIMYSLIASLIVTVLYLVVTQFFLGGLTSFITISQSSGEGASQITSQLYLILGMVVLGGTLLGGITSHMATTRYLKL